MVTQGYTATLVAAALASSGILAGHSFGELFIP